MSAKQGSRRSLIRSEADAQRHDQAAKAQDARKEWKRAGRGKRLGPLGSYLRHAELFGTEAVLETAINDGDFSAEPTERVEELAKLAVHLKALDKKWQSPVPVSLAPYLIRCQGHSVTTIAALCGVTRRTIERESLKERGGGRWVELATTYTPELRQ